MYIRNKIWITICDVNVNSLCARDYATLYRRMDIIYKFIIPFLSALCALFTKIESVSNINIVFYSAIIMFVFSSIKALLNATSISKDTIYILDNLFKKYSDIENKLANLMQDLDKGIYSEEKITKKFNYIAEEITQINKELNSKIVWIPKFIEKKLQMESKIHLKNTYYEEYQ